MNKDSEFLAGRDSGKSRTTKDWINKAEWDYFRAFRKQRQVEWADNIINDKVSSNWTKGWAELIKLDANSKLNK